MSNVRFFKCVMSEERGIAAACKSAVLLGWLACMSSEVSCTESAGNEQCACCMSRMQ